MPGGLFGILARQALAAMATADVLPDATESPASAGALRSGAARVAAKKKSAAGGGVDLHKPLCTPQRPKKFHVHGTTYYVSASGDDNLGNGSRAHPFRTVGKVNGLRLKPGDAVLFEAGATFDDDTLMPTKSGTASKPIIFGSYGTGKAVLPQGVWMESVQHLVIQDFSVPSSGIAGAGEGSGAHHITVQNNDTSNPSDLGINSTTLDSNWTIVGNYIHDTGNSGMLLHSTTGPYRIDSNTITRTGLTQKEIGYPTHGIYLKAPNSTVCGNTFSHNEGGQAVSQRYRNGVIERNKMSDGSIGLAFFNYDDKPGVSYWRNNHITNETTADLFVCGPREGCSKPLETFVIQDNWLSHAPGAVYTNLQPTSGHYYVSGNHRF